MLDLDLRSEKKGPGSWLLVVGLVLLLIAGALLAWWGFSGLGGGGAPVEPTATVPQTPLLPTRDPNATPVPIATLPPTPTSTPIATLTPTPEPPSPTPAVAYVIAGADGANVRTGPGTGYNRVGYITPGGQATVIGRYGGWWEVMYQGGEGWVFGDIVTAYNVEGVPEVVPPPAPTAAPVPPTAVPPTAVPPTAVPPTTAPVSARGIIANSYTVERAPGPYAVNADIWFNMDVSNTSNSTVEYIALGTVVEQTNQFQKSWTYSNFTPGQRFTWRDHLNIPAAGSYNLWLTICFMDGECARLAGPIAVTVQ